MKEPSKIDIRAKKTEAQWIMVSDHFWLAVTPRLFEWLRWTVILAAVTYVARDSDSPTLKLFVGLCYGALLAYFQAFFFQFEFINLPWLKSKRSQRVASVVLAFILGLVTFWIVKLSIDALVSAQS